MAVRADFASCHLPELIETDSRRQLCGGELLLRIRLDSSEIASLAEPSPLFRLASRLAYLPFLFNDVYEHFKASLPPKMGQAYEIWFDYDGVPLKWHFPLGVLCDLLVGADVPMPMDLTVHFRGGEASRELMPFTGISSLERVVMSAFRQAVFLEQNNTAAFGKLAKQQQTQLWDSIAKSNIEAFSALQQKSGMLCQNLSKCRSLAVRVHFAGAASESLLHPVSPSDDQGVPTTVLSFLREAVPPLVADLDGADELREGVQILTQGVIVPADTPLFWLALNACYLDHFVHLVVHTSAPLSQGEP
jgi:autophagy-related protein 5